VEVVEGGRELRIQFRTNIFKLLVLICTVKMMANVMMVQVYSEDRVEVVEGGRELRIKSVTRNYPDTTFF
jgi:hypothetical protein